MINMPKKTRKQSLSGKIAKTRQKSHAVASKSITSGIISPAVKDVLNGLSIGGLYITEFGWFERTGEKELTMIMITENPNFKAEPLVEQLKKIVESMGWMFKYDDKIKYSGVVYYMGEKLGKDQNKILGKMKQESQLPTSKECGLEE